MAVVVSPGRDQVRLFFGQEAVHPGEQPRAYLAGALMRFHDVQIVIDPDANMRMKG